MIGETISHYKILSRLGAGGMGVVYEAEDTRLGRRVAIKFLPDDVSADADAIQRFQREARVISNLNHPHICTLYDIGSHPSTPDRSSDAQPAGRSGQGGRQFMVMELLDGQPLKDRLERGALAVDEVLELGAQIADALDAAHAQGVVHRDIKPANLFVTRRGTIKVLDFGVAKLSEAGRSADGLAATTGGSDQLTTIGTTIGTVAYMSPEQARGQEIDARSDLFSAGVVLYEMATGQLPFQGPTVATIFESLLTKAPMAPSEIKAGIPAELDRIILKALEKDRETRYQGAAELRADLKRLKRAADSGLAPLRRRRQPAAVHGRPVHRSAKREGGSGDADPGWRKPVFIGAPLVTALAVAGFFFYRSINTPALTQKDSVVLSSVVNRTGDTMFDDTLGEALALQLRQSPFLNVVPEQQVQATLRLMGREPMTPITAELGREICQRSGAKALLGGTIAMLGSSYVLTLNAQDCVDGNVLAEEQAQATSKETVLQAMGTAVSAFREKLGESLASIQRYDAKIEEATTPSLEALKAYSQGLRTRRTTGDFDSVPFFRRAIDLDPEFALAYARLGTVYANLGQADESRKMTTKAYELREQGQRGRAVLHRGALLHDGADRHPEGARHLQVWLATYPNDYTALANSALLHKQQGDRAGSDSQARARHEGRARSAAGVVTNLGQTYFEAGEYAEAPQGRYENAILLQDSTGARVGLYQIAILTGDTALADRAGRRRRAAGATKWTWSRSACSPRPIEGRMKEASELAAEFQARALALSRRPQAAGNGILQLAISEALFGLIRSGEGARRPRPKRTASWRRTPPTIAWSWPRSRRTPRWRASCCRRALEQHKKSGGDEPQAAEAERAARALARWREGKPAEAVPLIEPCRSSLAHRRRQHLDDRAAAGPATRRRR